MAGICLFDSANMRSTRYFRSGSRRLHDTMYDLKGLKHELRALTSVSRYEFVINKRNDRNRHGLRHYVQKSGWRFKELSKSRFGFDPNDATDDYIHNTINIQNEEYGLKNDTIIVCSHDGGYAKTLVKFIESGGRVWLVGYEDAMSQRLKKLIDFDVVNVVDLSSQSSQVLYTGRSSSALKPVKRLLPPAQSTNSL